MIQSDRRYFVKCEVDGFINWSRPYSSFATALAECRRLDDAGHDCAPHSVTTEQWVPPLRVVE